ncbi:lysophosphatidylcholine acyltransferase 1-like protein [Labeo rohita]|uniref:Lysophosphatidylcholine acyltransferase 1-like protein n=1 Tax=Labeo rohita TaxID=84645 RepID=A0A498M8S6_LABRO|nr:lysophosphatidylcholine acyltransferase 1-like protein [Labeo rohita]
MRLIKSTHADGEEKRELPPPFRNPFVHDLRFTTAQKLQVRAAFAFADVDGAVGREMLCQPFLSGLQLEGEFPSCATCCARAGRAYQHRGITRVEPLQHRRFSTYDAGGRLSVLPAYFVQLDFSRCVSEKMQQLRVKLFTLSDRDLKLGSPRHQMNSRPALLPAVLSFSSRSLSLFTASLNSEWKRSGNCEISLIQKKRGLQLRITRTLKSALQDLLVLLLKLS